VDLLLICDSYLGLDQQYSIPLGGSTGGGEAATPPLVGQAARRARRQEQAAARRQHAAQEQQPAISLDPAPMADAGGALPHHPLQGAATQQLEQLQELAPTLDCRLAPDADGQAGASADEDDSFWE
jgi:hypothetical protein